MSTVEKGQLLAEARTLVSDPEERVGRRKFSGLDSVLDPTCHISEILRASSAHPCVVPGSIAAEKELEPDRCHLSPHRQLSPPHALSHLPLAPKGEKGFLKAVLRHQAQSSKAAWPVNFYQPGRQCRHGLHLKPVGGQGVTSFPGNTLALFALMSLQLLSPSRQVGFP